MWIDTDKGARYHLFFISLSNQQDSPTEIFSLSLYGDCKILFCGKRAVYSDGLDRKFDLRCAS